MVTFRLTALCRRCREAFIHELCYIFATYKAVVPSVERIERLTFVDDLYLLVFFALSLVILLRFQQVPVGFLFMVR